MEQVFRDFYKIADDEELDAKNTARNMLRKAQDLRLSSGKDSLSSMKVQTQKINRALMSQQPQWIQDAWRKYIKSIKSEAGDVRQKVDIFTRLRRDSKNRRFRRRAIDKLSSISSSPLHPATHREMERARRALD